MCDNKLQKVHVMLTAIDVVKGEVDISSRTNSYKNPDSSTKYLTLINIHLVLSKLKSDYLPVSMITQEPKGTQWAFKTAKHTCRISEMP